MKTGSLLAVAALAVVLSACADENPEAAPGDDPTPSTTPSGPPWPEYAEQDYSYTLRLSCFCAYRNAWTVTVQDGKVVEVVNKRSGETAPPDVGAITINDVIDAANDDEAFKVDVKWPDGQGYPSWVYVDKDEHAVDEEIGYTIRDVQPR